jgi:transcriptional regulator with XRE-family HTH domain
MQEILSKKNIGERIKILRINNNHSQLFVADILCLSRSNYSQIELGNQFPTFETLYTISRYYNKSYDWLLHGFMNGVNSQLSDEELHLLSQKKLKPITLTSVNESKEIKIVSIKKDQRSYYVDKCTDVSYITDLQPFKFPLNLKEKYIYRAFYAEDSENINTIHSGDTIIGRSINDFSEIIGNEIYVVVTKTNIILCRVYSILPVKELLVCKTDDLNDDWFTLSFDIIQEIWLAEGKYSTRLEPFITDLSFNIKHLEHTLTKIEKEITFLKSKIK